MAPRSSSVAEAPAVGCHPTPVLLWAWLVAHRRLVAERNSREDWRCSLDSSSGASLPPVGSGITTRIQIYGVTTRDDAVMSARLGAHHVGVAVDEQGFAPDGVSVSDARAILAVLPPSATRLALTLARDPDEVAYVASEVRPEILHVGADPDFVGPGHVERLRLRFPEIRFMRAVAVDGPAAVATAVEAARVADFVLLDTRDQTIGKIGATGRTHDWHLSAEIVRTVDTPVLLAGGLSADNVGEAIRIVRPWGVDSYSLTCVDGDLRRKDEDKVARFVAAVHKADCR